MFLSGIFVAFGGHQRHGMVHHSQISVDLTLDKDDVDEDKMTALEYFCPRGSEVLLLHPAGALTLQKQSRMPPTI